MLILDTNVLSESMQPSPSVKVLTWLINQQAGMDIFVTSITVAEILYGIEILPRGKRRDTLQAQAEAMFAEDFVGRVLPFDEEAARMFSSIAATRRSKGRPIAEFDAQIAAIARANGAILATRNTSDFEGCGVRLLNPWQE